MWLFLDRNGQLEAGCGVGNLYVYLKIDLGIDIYKKD